MIARLLKAELVFAAGWTLGGIYVAALLTVPKLLNLAARLL